MKFTKIIIALALLACAALVGAQTKFAIGVLNNNLSSNIRNAPTYVDARVLAANTNESHTKPTGASYVIFSSNCAAFYAELGGTAAVPAADVTDGTASELNPAAWIIPRGVTTVGLISPTTCTVTLSWYTI